uniref:Adenylate kinase n=1 Tax=candidate division WOR-3 bacterium TaxID=2052148 RepID=A0A7C4YJ31_UNCW3
MKIALLGPPGSGKGTQGKMLAADLKIPYFSTGDAFRETKDEDIKKYLKEGRLVPDDVVFKIVIDFINDKDSYILDGYPRSVNQAIMLDDFLDSRKERLDLVLNIIVSDDEIIERLTNRYICKNCNMIYNLRTNPPKKDFICDVCGNRIVKREDDKEEVIRKRIKIYYDETQPIIDYYKKKSILKEVDGNEKPKIVFEIIRNLITNGQK